jgi:hypothetical protein
MKLYAVIPTAGDPDRLPWLTGMLQRLSDDGVHPIVVNNGSDPYLYALRPADSSVIGTHWDGNLSRVWNLGLRHADFLASGAEYVVAVFNDDLTLPAGIVQTFSATLSRTGAAAVHASWTGMIDDRVYTQKDPWHLGNRMIGYAFALRGSAGLFADEDLCWWWGDSDLDWRARGAGGVTSVHVPGLVHHDPNGYTNRCVELSTQAGRDRETFRAKHGFLPW